MCHKTALVPIPDFLVSDYEYIFAEPEISGEFGVDEQGRQCFALDACIVPAVQMLWDAGIRTSGCCCGHGSGHGVVSIEVPNGGDVERRDRQTRSFYERHAQSRDTPQHKFGASNFRETGGYTEAQWREMIAKDEERLKGN